MKKLCIITMILSLVSALSTYALDPPPISSGPYCQDIILECRYHAPIALGCRECRACDYNYCNNTTTCTGWTIICDSNF